jgi:hypothetical protein
MSSRITKIWLNPPLAFARIGSSEIPVDAYLWGEKELDPKGSNKVAIIPAPTLLIDKTGAITEYQPKEIHFKEVTDEGEIFRPVCPWYELHCEIKKDDGISTGPVTLPLLSECGLKLQDIQWSVHLENRKSFHMTLDDDNKIIGKLDVLGDDTTRKEIKGTSPESAVNPLIPFGRYIPIGEVQVVQPDINFPEIRIRITPSKGLNYGPTNLHDKITQLINTPGFEPVSNFITDDWSTLKVPQENLFLNPNSTWCTFTISGGDGRTQPGSLFSLIEIISPDKKSALWYSLGIVDDVSDGIISCQIKNAKYDLKAMARVVICPQDFAPDRRHVATLADNFKDRADHLPLDQTYEGVPYEELAAEIQDIFDRVFETMGFMNLDIINQKTAFADSNRKPPFVISESVLPLPLTQIGRQRHRRFVALSVLETIMREEIGREETGSETGYPKEIKPIIDMFNQPLYLKDDAPYKNNSHRKMPALMRGSDSNPMHLTRRQYELILLWIKKTRENILKEIKL